MAWIMIQVNYFFNGLDLGSVSKRNGFRALNEICNLPNSLPIRGFAGNAGLLSKNWTLKSSALNN